MEKRYFEVEGIPKNGKRTYTKYFIPDEPCKDKRCDFSHIGGCADTTCLCHAFNTGNNINVLNDWNDAMEVKHG